MSERDALIGIWDFRALPYALGDVLTWSVRLCVLALNGGYTAVDVYVLSDAYEAGNKWQPQVSAANHQRFLLEFLPAFFCNPMLRSFRVYSDREEFERDLLLLRATGRRLQPDVPEYVADYARRLAKEYNSHDIINAFHNSTKSVPHLVPPKGSEVWAKNFASSFGPGTLLVCVHMRQRRLEVGNAIPVWGERDAKTDDWLRFLRHVQDAHPEVRFVVVGKPLEWPREIFRLANVTVPKAMGYGLVEELALIQECDLFMGTNSGPAVMAIYGSKPYLIFEGPSSAPLTARLWQVEPGARRLPFATDHQVIVWGEATLDRILSSFEETYRAIASGTSEGTPGGSCRVPAEEGR